MVVPVTTGEVNRTWKFKGADGQIHQLDLYHHTVTGARGALLDHELLEGSEGTSSIMTKRHDIRFQVGQIFGSLSIRRRGDVLKGLGFDYTCTFDGCTLAELTMEQEDCSPSESNKLRVALSDPTVAAFGSGGTDEHVALTWYPLHTERVSDNTSTTVHRRFREFVEIDETVRAALSGSHLQSSLPCFPPKQSKLLTDHTDRRFLEQRREQLQVYINRIIDVPHVLQVPSMLPFLGLANHMREVSFVFPAKSIGITIQRAGGSVTKEGGVVTAAVGVGFPAVVELVRTGPAKGVLRPGDILSKVMCLCWG